MVPFRFPQWQVHRMVQAVKCGDTMSAVARDYAYQVKIGNGDKSEPTVGLDTLKQYQDDIEKYIRKGNDEMKEKKIERETHYEYDENGELTSMTIHETITNPNCDDCGYIDDVDDDAELMTGEIEVKTEHSFVDVAFGLAALGLTIAAIVAIFKKDKE